MGHNKSFSVNTFSAHDDDFEFDEAYFRTFYKPLSNLPTPPLSSQSSSATQSPRMLADDAEPLNSDLLGKSYPPRSSISAFFWVSFILVADRVSPAL